MPNTLTYFRRISSLLFALCCLFGHKNAEAQLDDTRLRQEIGLTYSPKKRWDINAMYRLDLEQNMSSFRRSNFEVGLSYDILDWLKISSAYRFGTSFDEDVHRLEIGLAFRKKLLQDKMQLTFKSTALLQSPYLNKTYFEIRNPDYLFRNKLRVKYSLTKKWDVFAFTELFARNRDKNTDFFRLRSGGGLSYTLKKRHQFSLAYFYQNEFNRSNPRNIQAFDIGYTYEIKRKKKKKPAAPATAP